LHQTTFILNHSLVYTVFTQLSEIANKLALGIVVVREYFLKKKNFKNKIQVNCLVVGFVQFGKTANMNVVSAILFDHGFRFIVFLSGNTIILRNQTAGRVYSALVNKCEEVGSGSGEKLAEAPASSVQIISMRSPNIADIYRYDPDETDVTQSIEEEEEEVLELRLDDVEEVFDVIMPGGEAGIKNDLGKRQLKQFNTQFDMNSSQRKYSRLTKGTEQSRHYYKVVFPVKKNNGIIQNLIECLSKYITKGDKIAIIDDECDVSVNSRAPGSEELKLYKGSLL